MNNLKKIRESQGLTQIALGRLCKPHLENTKISQLESGVQYPFPGYRKRLAEALGVSEEEIWND